MTPFEARILLDLQPDPTEDELRSAYRSMLRAWHPDRFPEGSDLSGVSTGRTRSIIEAFHVLRDDVAARVDAGAAPGCPPAARALPERARDPLHFTGPTPEKAVSRPQDPPRRNRDRSWAAALALTTALAAVVALVMVRGGGPVEAASPPVGQAAAYGSTDGSASAPTSVQGVERVAAPVARYSMTIGSFRDLDRAMTVVERVRRGAPGVWATTVPVEVEGTVFQRVLVGFSRDQESLDGLVETVSAVLGEDPGRWIQRDAGLVLCLSEAGDLEEARDLMAALSQMGISSYAVGVESPGGEPTVRVCTGSFDKPAEADYLKRTLLSQGFDPSLEPRTGEPLHSSYPLPPATTP